jgi:DNA replication protein DnaC
MLTAQTLEQQLRQLLLPTFAKRYVDLATQCEAQQKSCIDYLSSLAQAELEHRNVARIAKLLKQAKLPRSKHLNEFDHTRVPGL